MPSFPTSVFAPTNKSAGQTIQHTHVNDLQDEVVAIEGGFRNATAPLNSSGSTLATLSVAGGSTLGGTLSVVGGSTFAGTLQVTGGSTFTVRPVEPPPDAVKLNLSSTGTLAVADGAFSTLGWAAGDHAINSSMFSGTNSSRVVPQSTGVYIAIAHVDFNFNSSGDRGVRIVDSSGGSVGRTDAQTLSKPSNHTIVCLTATKRFDVVGGWFKVQATQNGASTMGINTNESHFAVYKL